MSKRIKPARVPFTSKAIITLAGALDQISKMTAALSRNLDAFLMRRAAIDWTRRRADQWSIRLGTDAGSMSENFEAWLASSGIQLHPFQKAWLDIQTPTETVRETGNDDD